MTSQAPARRAELKVAREDAAYAARTGPTPAAVVREHLAEARQRGEPFDSTWPLARAAALADLERWDAGQWAFALTAAKASFRRAFEGAPATNADLAVGALADGGWP